MTPELEVADRPADAAARVAALVARRARSAGGLALALSRAPADLLRALSVEDVPWAAVDVYQVDERVAPDGAPERNVTGLLAGLPAEAHARIHAMPVDEPDLDAAAEWYARALPAALDVVHLGLGADGHTASLVPGDRVLDIADRTVAATGEYRGFRRMTLTYAALDAAHEIVWLVTGEEKRDALARLLARDTSIPAARVAAARQLVVADRAAAR